MRARPARWWRLAAEAAPSMTSATPFTGAGGAPHSVPPAAASAAAPDVPTIEVAAVPRHGLLAVLMTGDGGWAPADRGALDATLASPVIRHGGHAVSGSEGPMLARIIVRAITAGESAH
jgi:type IV secretory pathway VirJ component